jgi:sigma-B regulation protein RsbU (phosphoserine phosphatase)
VSDAHHPVGDLFEVAPCGYALVDDTGLITHANAEFRRLVGRRPEALVEKVSLASLFSVGGRMFLETHLLPMLAHDRSVREVALDVVRLDGSRVPVLLNADAVGDGPALRVVLMETRERHRYEQDLLTATRSAEQARIDATALAHTLQQTLIPPVPPQVPHLRLATAYRPAGDGSVVGGDFYDVFQVGAEDWWVVLGDVSGKGIAAATVTSFVRYTIRALAIDHRKPDDLLARLDHAMHVNGTDHYCTLVLARLTRKHPHWAVQLALAGHAPALLRTPDGRVSEVGTPGNPVGLVDEPVFHTVHHLLQDETLTFYTDGVTEARSADGWYGDTRLHELVAQADHDPQVITDEIAGEALRFQGGVASDDIAVVTFAASPAAGADEVRAAR